jgi:hypothetical protein
LAASVFTLAASVFTSAVMAPARNPPMVCPISREAKAQYGVHAQPRLIKTGAVGITRDYADAEPSRGAPGRVRARRAGSHRRTALIVQRLRSTAAATEPKPHSSPICAVSRTPLLQRQPQPNPPPAAHSGGYNGLASGKKGMKGKEEDYRG